MTEPNPLRTPRAHVLEVPHAVALRLGDTTITALINPEGSIDKNSLALYEEIAKKINDELDATGRMNMSRASEITHETEEHQRRLDVERTAHWLRRQFVAELEKHERLSDNPAQDDYYQTPHREAWEAMAEAVLRAGAMPPADFVIPFAARQRLGTKT